jgi:hypothetical protein
MLLPLPLHVFVNVTLVVYNYHLVLGPLFHEGLSDILISAVRELNSHVEDKLLFGHQLSWSFFLIPRGAAVLRGNC